MASQDGESREGIGERRPEAAEIGDHFSPIAFLLSRSGVGGVAQLGEHLLCKQGVGGSSPLASTTLREELRVAGQDALRSPARPDTGKQDEVGHPPQAAADGIFGLCCGCD